MAKEEADTIKANFPPADNPPTIQVPVKPFPPPSPEKRGRPPKPKGTRNYTGPTYQYKLEDYTIATRDIVFKTNGAQGWRFVGTEAGGKAVFERPLQ